MGERRRSDGAAPRRRRLRLTEEEAERIRAQDLAGRLDHDDPEVRRVLAEANRASVRAHVYGATPPARRQWLGIAVVVAVAVVLFILGLSLTVLLEQR